jgi:hypothetical protein
MPSAVATQTPLSARALVLLAAALAGHLLLWWISEPEVLFNDFFKAYYPVAEHLWADGIREGWPSLEVGAGGFVNLPIVGWLFAPFAAFEEMTSGWVYLAVGLPCTLWAWHLLAHHFAGRHAVALLLLFLVNGPLINSLREGNSTHLILLLLALGLVAWRAGRGFLAGVAFAACGIIKLPLLLLGPYFLVRRSWAIVAGMAATGIVTGLLSLAVHGIEVNVGWYRDSVAPFLGGVIPAFNVQSIDGFLLRLSTGASLLQDWVPFRPSLAHRIVRYALVLALLGGAWWLMRRAAGAADTRRRDLVEFSLVLTIALVISPICWTHYYLLMLLPAALQLGGLLLLEDDARWRTAFWIGYALSALPVVMLPVSPDLMGEVVARTLVSLWLFGGLAILACQARSLWRMGAR